MNKLRKADVLLVFTLMASVAIISLAWVLEYVGGLVPCHLCLQDRVPYYIAITLLLVSGVVSMKRSNANIVLALLLSCIVLVVFAYGIDISAYHAGVEWGFWDGPASCTQIGASAKTLDDYISQLTTTQFVDCSKPALVFAGLSLAGWNVVANAILMIMIGYSAKLRADHVFNELKAL